MTKTLPRVLPRLLLGLALLAAIAAAVVWRDRFDAAALRAWVEGAGAAGPLVFMAIYALATVLFLPGSVLTLAGGALFGPLWGTLWNLTGATLGAALAFLVARYLGADWVARRAGPRLQRLNDGVAAEGWRFVAFVRLVPLFPFNLLNYALGLTRIPFLAYVLASWLFMLPGAIAYTWLGYAGREALAGGEGMIRNILIALALLAAVGFLPRLVKRLRAKPAVTLDIPGLKARLGGDTVVLDVRDAADFAEGHIAGARNIPLPELKARLAELEDWRDRPVAVVCRTDKRSAQVVQWLGEQGFKAPLLVKEGMQRWKNDGLPMSTHETRQP
ncbi:MAG TPA: VTT domain-containing protein [Thiobacillaceae bacterium]|nr:VTT domain-containing protein [Thiobacillaceae bacterium]